MRSFLIYPTHLLGLLLNGCLLPETEECQSCSDLSGFQGRLAGSRIARGSATVDTGRCTTMILRQNGLLLSLGSATRCLLKLSVSSWTITNLNGVNPANVESPKIQSTTANGVIEDAEQRASKDSRKLRDQSSKIQRELSSFLFKSKITPKGENPLTSLTSSIYKPHKTP
ncbi:hypothetical protein VNO77_37864 [Canavalia gladiata]|uniref:Uncharacterized protein n=1 Tax=Canavalia gladiata TaxID=3824 RepID=A0AAN9KBT5_CANGL